MKRLFNATLNSFRGIRYAIRYEAAVREEAIALALALPVGFAIAPNTAWYIAMIGALLILLAIEFLNTAIEKLSDYVTPEVHPEIGLIKDFCSAAVFCALCLAALVWLTAIVCALRWRFGAPA